MTATVFDLKRFAVHDGDGIRTTLFFKGCPLKCVWCHNPEGLSRHPVHAYYAHKCVGCGACAKEGFDIEQCLGEARVLYGKEVTVDEVLPLLLEDREFYESSGGGVTLSGGECLLQADFCAALLSRLQEHGIHTAIDTCGCVPREHLDRVIPFTDVFLYDLKAYDEDVHIRCTGVSNRQILENLSYLERLGKSIEIRIPYVPAYNADQIEKIARFLADFKHIEKLRVLPYHNYAASKYAALGMENTLPAQIPTDEELDRARDLIERITRLPIIR